MMGVWLEPGMIIVLVMRLLGPLLILRWPLAGTLLSQLVFDMFDVVIWDATGVLGKIDYTAVEKPLDLYQLTIQLIVVFAWKQKYPKRLGIGLYFYRLVGFIVYELTKARVCFLIFPNFFLTFFLIYLIALKCHKASWFETKRSLAWVLLAVLCLKVPHEYLLHYARLEPWTLTKQGLSNLISWARQLRF